MSVAVGRKYRSCLYSLENVGLNELRVETRRQAEGWESFVLPLSEPMLLLRGMRHGAWRCQLKALRGDWAAELFALGSSECKVQQL